MALLSLLTVSYGQTSDSLKGKFYTLEELKLIAARVVRAAECDTLLSTCELQLAEKDSAIFALHEAVSSKDSVIVNKSGIIIDQEAIIDGKDLEISELREVLNKDKRKLTWLKIGWATSSAVLTGLFLYFLVN